MQAEELPSGGFARNSLRNLGWTSRGLLGQIAKPDSAPQEDPAEVDLAVCVGDV